MHEWTKYDNPCITNAADDEPLFVLRAQDRFAPSLVRLWAGLVETFSGRSAKTESARLISLAMEAWQRRTMRCKIPD